MDKSKLTTVDRQTLDGVVILEDKNPDRFAKRYRYLVNELINKHGGKSYGSPSQKVDGQYTSFVFYMIPKNCESLIEEIDKA